MSLALTDHFLALPSRWSLKLDVLDGMGCGLVLIFAVVRVRIVLLVEITFEWSVGQSRIIWR